MNERFEYGADEYNRLTINGRPETASGAGRFSVRENRLAYVFEGTTAASGRQVLFSGEWALDEAHNLVFSLREANDGWGRIVLKGRIVAVDAHRLAFEAIGLSKEGIIKWQIFELSGSWSNDGGNLLAFSLLSELNPGRLVLRGAWKVNADQQITYSYQTRVTESLRAERIEVVFKGSWLSACDNRIVYLLSGAQGEQSSRFDFRVQIQTANLYPARGVIKYRVGIGVLGRHRALTRMTVCLYGEWKFGRAFRLGFEMRYGPAGTATIYFDAGFITKDGRSWAVSLNSTAGSPSGITLRYSRELLLRDNKARIFIEFISKRGEQSLNAGLSVKF